ncbi:membrane alanyl aminopeptidase-like, partial [Manduca sexta]|uniref:membrane alanyl aminopeptidase-like n=1 Tax=Manduca sexta TaxID=7130 RepID=UPI00188F8192
NSFVYLCSGIYRVNYDTQNWQLIAAALSKNVSDIHHLNRAQIVDDVFALMRSGRMTYDLGFQVLDFLKKDTSYYSWYPAITGFTWLRNRFLHMPDVLAEFDEILFGYLNALITDLGYEVVPDEPVTRTLNRFFALTFACNIGHEGCVRDAAQKFNALRTSGARVNPNLRRHVFCTGLRKGGYEDWRFLYERRRNSNNQADDLAMLRALGCTTDNRARQEYLEMILTDEVKAQDTVNAFTFFYMGDRSNARVALEFLKPRVEQVRQAVVLPAWFDSVLSNLASYLDEEGLQDMEQWLNANRDTIPNYNVGLSAISSTRANMRWGTQNANIVLTAARGAAVVVLPTTMLFLSTLFALLLK